MKGECFRKHSPETMPETREFKRQYIYAGRTYGPGEIEVPDDLLKIASDESKKDTLHPDFRKEINGEDPGPSPFVSVPMDDPTFSRYHHLVGVPISEGLTEGGEESPDQGDEPTVPPSIDNPEPEEPDNAPLDTGDDLDALALDDHTKAALAEGGYRSQEDVRNASDEELDALPKIGAAKIREIRAAVGQE